MARSHYYHTLLAKRKQIFHLELTFKGECNFFTYLILEFCEKSNLSTTTYYYLLTYLLLLLICANCLI